MFKNWKTTVAGIGTAALNLLANGTSWKQILFSSGITALGLLMKDFNVTGGSVPQTPEAVNRATTAKA